MSTPWLTEKDWQPPFRSNAKTVFWGTWIFCVLWNLVSVPLIFVLPGEVMDGNYAALAGLLFPVVGVFLLVWAVRVSREYRRYGITELSLDPYPGSIGGHLGASLVLPRAAGTRASYRASLHCMHSRVSGSGKNRKRREDIVWETGGPMTVSADPAGVKLQCRFDVPKDLPQSEPQSRSYHFWRLTIESDHDKVPLSRSFNVPVFPTAQASEQIRVDSGAQALQHASYELNNALIDERAAERLRQRFGMSLEVRADWIRLFFHLGRQKTLSTVLFLVGLAFTGVFWIPDQDAVVIRWVFAIIGVLMVVGGLYITFNTLDVRINRQQISRVRKWFGVVIKKQDIQPNQLRSLHIVKGASSQSQNRTVVYYRLIGKGDFGEFRFAEGIDDKVFLDALLQKIQDFAGLQRQPDP